MTIVRSLKHRRKKKPPSALARSWRLARFLERKSAGNPELASPEDKQNIAAVSQLKQESVNSLREKELENTSPTSGSKGNPASLENPAQARASESDSDLLFEQTILKVVLDTSDSDNDVSSIHVNNLCANCKHMPQTGKYLVRDVILLASAVLSARKRTDFHRFAYSVVTKRSALNTKRSNFISATWNCNRNITERYK